MKFPYGLADFYKIRQEGYFYQDRTPFIRVVEEWGTQLVFAPVQRSPNLPYQVATIFDDEHQHYLVWQDWLERK